MYLPVAPVSHIIIVSPQAVIQSVPESVTLAAGWTSEELVSGVFSEVGVQISLGLVNLTTFLAGVLPVNTIQHCKSLKIIFTLHCQSCEPSPGGFSSRIFSNICRTQDKDLRGSHEAQCCV